MFYLLTHFAPVKFRYEQAKHVDGLQSDGRILLFKMLSFSSYGWLQSP